MEFKKLGPISRYSGNDAERARALYDSLDNAAIFETRDGRVRTAAMKFSDQKAS
jgi:hypothetical protein